MPVDAIVGASEASRDVSVIVPATTEFVKVVRLTAAGVASRLGFDVEEIADVRVAVDELATLAVEHSGPGKLTVTFVVEDHALRIDGSAPTGRSTPEVDELMARILGAVADKSDVYVDGDRIVFCCIRRLPARSR